MANAYVQPIELPTECGNDLRSIDAVAVGIGRPTFFDNYEILLRHADVRAMSFAECSKHIGEKCDTFLCAKPNGEQAVFRGDSGINNYYYSSAKYRILKCKMMNC